MGVLAHEMRVAHVLWSGGTGGIERLVLDLAGQQRADGLHVTVAFGRAAGPFVEQIRGAATGVADLGFASGYDLRAGKLRAAARELRGADVVHLHAFNVPLGAACALASRPLVFTDHGFVPAAGLPTARALIKGLPLRAMIRRTGARVAANSVWTAQRGRRFHGLAPASVAVVHNGVAADPAAPEASPRATSDGLRVAFVGRLVHFKRVDRLIRAISLIESARRPRVEIIGAGPLGEELSSLARRLGVTGAVHFLGRRDDVPSILAGMDVLVLPSQGEPFGLAAIEACNAGALPIVFADAGGAREALPPDGIVVGDEAALAVELERLAADPEPLGESRRAARRRWVHESFSITKTAASYLGLYREAIAQREAGR